MTDPREKDETTVDGTVLEFKPDALAQLYRRGGIDFQQYEAGQRLRLRFRRAEMSPCKAQEYDRVFMDHDVVLGRCVDLYPRVGDELKALLDIEQRMGIPDWPIVLAIVEEDMRFAQMLRMMPRILARYSERTLGHRVSESFDKLTRYV